MTPSTAFLAFLAPHAVAHLCALAQPARLYSCWASQRAALAEKIW